jgi:transcriptional regulator with XRE-family HTH domain
MSSVVVERDAVGSRVRKLRQERSMTQDDLAGLLELDKSAVCRVESGERGLAVPELAVLAAHFGVSTDFLLFGEREEEVLLRAEGDAAAAVEFAREVVKDMEFLGALQG